MAEVWQLFYSPLSRSDLDEIFRHIAEELENPAAARETIDAILSGAEMLEGFPHAGSVVRGLPPGIGEYRFLTVRNWLIFYRLSEPRVFVDRILYRRREYIDLLNRQ